MKLIKSVFLIFILFLVFEIKAFAIPVPIINASFEQGLRPVHGIEGDYGATPINGWVANGSVGTLAPSAVSFSGDIPDGNSVAWVNENSSISQYLNHTVNAGNTLTLAVDVGLRLDVPDSGAFSIEILAGGNQLTSISSEVGSLTVGEFQTWSLSYDIVNNDPFIGQQLSIAFHNLSALQVNFDNVHFDNDLTPVPEPATVLLFGIGLAGLAGYRKKSKR